MKQVRNPQRATLAVLGGSLLGSIGVAIACVGPLVGIAFGIGGLGFLTRYHWLRLPATVATVVLLALGFWLAYGPGSKGCGQARFSRRQSVVRGLLWLATALAVSVQVFEHLLLPRL